MSWTEEKDVLLMREMAARGIFQFKSGSRERGTVWQAIAKNLNGHKDLFHSVTSRGVRDRFTLILRRYKAKNTKELKSTGEGSEDELSEYDLLLEELTHLSEESDKKANAEAESAKEKISAEKELALDIRKRAMETMGQTSKRTKSDELQDEERNEELEGTPCRGWKKKRTEILSTKSSSLKSKEKKQEFQQRERKEQMELIQKQLQMQGESQKQQQQQQMMLMQQMMSIMQQQKQQLQLFTSKQDKD